MQKSFLPLPLTQIPMSEELSVDGQLDHVMRETRHFPPSKEFAQKARVSSIQQYEELYKQSMEDNENFWAELARKSCIGSNHLLKHWNGVSPTPSGSSMDKPTRPTIA